MKCARCSESCISEFSPNPEDLDKLLKTYQSCLNKQREKRAANKKASLPNLGDLLQDIHDKHNCIVDDAPVD
jgi:hypothetical protein